VLQPALGESRSTRARAEAPRYSGWQLFAAGEPLFPGAVSGKGSDYSSVETNMLVLVLNGITKPLHHRDPETQRKAIGSRYGPLCLRALCGEILRHGDGCARSALLFPGAVREKACANIDPLRHGLRQFSSFLVCEVDHGLHG